MVVGIKLQKHPHNIFIGSLVQFLYLFTYSQSKTMEYVCDFSFLFDVDGKRMMKGASVVPIYVNAVGHWITSPPYPFRQLNLQLRRKNNKETLQQHHLHWNYGETPIDELQDHLVQLLFDSTRIFLHGQVKVDIMKKLLPNHDNIIDLPH